MRIFVLRHRSTDTLQARQLNTIDASSLLKAVAGTRSTTDVFEALFQDRFWSLPMYTVQFRTRPAGSLWIQPLAESFGCGLHAHRHVCTHVCTRAHTHASVHVNTHVHTQVSILSPRDGEAIAVDEGMSAILTVQLRFEMSTAWFGLFTVNGNIASGVWACEWPTLLSG